MSNKEKGKDTAQPAQQPARDASADERNARTLEDDGGPESGGEPETRPDAPQSREAPPLLALDTDDVNHETLPDQIRSAHASARAKDAANLTDEEKAEADRWVQALQTMVRMHRGPARISIVQAPDGQVQANILSGREPKTHMSGTLVLAGEVPAPKPPPPQPRAAAAGPASGATRQNLPAGRVVPGARLAPAPPRGGGSGGSSRR